LIAFDDFGTTSVSNFLPSEPLEDRKCFEFIVISGDQAKAAAAVRQRSVHGFPHEVDRGSNSVSKPHIRDFLWF
jgi:hypothetical protein